jgi:lactam utilization protein B
MEVLVTRRESFFSIVSPLFANRDYENKDDLVMTEKVLDALEENQREVVLKCAKIARGLAEAGITGEEIERVIFGEFDIAR